MDNLLKMPPYPSKKVLIVDCQSVEYKTQPNKYCIYVLEVIWSTGEIYKIYRPYTAFLEFRNFLKSNFKEHPEVHIPDLPSAKWFERSFLSSKDSKKLKTLDEFCQHILQFPERIVCSQQVITFFERWGSDPHPSPSQQSVGTRSGKEIRTLIEGYATKQIGDQSHTSTNKNMGNTSAAATPPSSTVPTTEAGSESLKESPLSHALSQLDEHQGAVEYVAVEEFYKDNMQEVNLRPGYTVDVLQKDLSGWWYVHVEETKEEGYVPASFLEPKQTDLIGAASNNGQSTGTSTEWFRAIADISALSKDELSYEAGEKLEVLEVNLDGWWKVRLKDVVGYTPGINLQPIRDSQSEATGITKTPKEQVTNNLYHHHSIYKRKSPPPRRTKIYASDDEKDSQESSKQKKRVNTVTYTEVVFEETPAGGASKPIIRKESAVTYSDILLLNAGTGDKKFKIVENNTEDGKEAYVNTTHSSPHSQNRTSLNPARAYVNVDINPAPSDGASKGDNNHSKSATATKTDAIDISVTNLDVEVPPPQSRPGSLSPAKVSGGTETHLADKTPEKSPAHMSSPTRVPSPSLPSMPAPLPHSATFPSKSGPEISVPTTVASAPKITALTLPPPAAASAPKSPTSGHSTAANYPTVIATCGYTSTKVNVLSFSEGDTAPLLSTRDDQGWWCVRLKGKKGWVPAEYWKYKDASPHQQQPEPVVTLPRVPSDPSSKDRRHSHSHETRTWFVGKMERRDCELHLLEHGNDKDFVVRESTNMVGNFTLSVKYSNQVKHFTIQAIEGKYNIGRHDFHSLNKVISYYQSNALFFDEQRNPVTLGQPLKVSTC